MTSDGNFFKSTSFPHDFAWGAATAAYQIEGAASEDGRQPSVWDVFSHTPGRTADGGTGDVACDHYHRFEEDIKLMVDLGIKHYRFSISWTRVLPEGVGKLNPKGIDFYSRLTDALLKHGITPHATLFHWDSPQALEQRFGSWRSREMAQAFADYSAVTVRHLGDRIQNWMTINEVNSFTYKGYGVDKIPKHAPGTVLKSRKELQQVVHHTLLGHGMACQAIRAAAPVKPSVSFVTDCDVFVPVVESAENIAAAHRAFAASQCNRTILWPVLTGQYSAETLAALGPDAPDIRPGDLAIIGQPLDSLGLNVYSGTYVRAADNAAGFAPIPWPADYPKMVLPWLRFVPESIYWVIRSAGEVMGRKVLPIYITENGCAGEDTVADDGGVHDSARILYLRSYLHNVRRAIAEGYPVRGYFVWSLMDNFEWSEGYRPRFGLIHVDYQTQKRTPKASFLWYREAVRNNRII